MTFDNDLKEKMFRRVLVFGAKYSAQLPPAATRLLPKIQQGADQLVSLGGAQVEAETDARGGTLDRGAAFKTLRTGMKRIHETARSIDHDDDLPDIGHEFLLPANQRLSTWLAFGQTYIDKATPLAPQFVEYGMAPTFLTDLQAAMTAAQAAEVAQDGGDMDRTGSVKTQNDLASATVKWVRGVGQTVENKFADDETVLREWESASKIEVRNVSPKAPVVPAKSVAV